MSRLRLRRRGRAGVEIQRRLSGRVPTLRIFVAVTRIRLLAKYRSDFRQLDSTQVKEYGFYFPGRYMHTYSSGELISVKVKSPSLSFGFSKGRGVNLGVGW
ncbi:glucan 1,3-beta-glucosidase A-like isoform X1 [Iris pallida]|uniref:Glucan 1,3-beta-glucosidase A-like isoform X1 n=1 Tax=Iris pallida TaxID=29817 RepID=A0AAX6ECJ0_IRIPA|nr:glucan 1,3-beta-glucosidase A-like isoform X1 [Iris pallida]KAJ6839252.1 glucan 1,3-beta-glucosidase A-like isoform X1 [Iris pallida]KAJ6839253.1 glucan 1,3-beta-glucosidase A-like isoform X1 [Iris pallida]